MKTTTIVALVSFAGAASIATLDAAVRSRSNAAMTRAANQFLQTLTPEQRVKAAFKFDSTERFNWFFTPVPRLGLPLKEMTEPQRTAARALLATGVSQRGLLKANTIIELELVLREMETGRITRDPELYFVSIFGTPSETQPWGWRFEGHHLSLNYTVSGSSMVAFAPSFFGVNPANVRTGPRAGTRALAPEEDLARDFMNSLDAERKAAAMLTGAIPGDIVTRNNASAQPLSPAGIPVSSLTADQTARLMRVIEEYLRRMSDDIANAREPGCARPISRVSHLPGPGH